MKRIVPVALIFVTSILVCVVAISPSSSQAASLTITAPYLMAFHACDTTSSADGLTFSADEGVRVENGSVPSSIVMPDVGIRMYNCSRGISVFESPDGLNFNLLREGVVRDETGAGLIICDPAVTAIANGYLMVYKTNE